MTTSPANVEAQRPATVLLRVAQGALVLNGLVASVVGIGFMTGLLPHASEQPFLARGLGTRELAGGLIMLVVAAWLRRDPSLIVLPMIFVGSNLAHSIYELAASRSTEHLPPLIVEATFFSVYMVYAAIRRRRAG